MAGEMAGEPVCPRCGRLLAAESCPAHGPVTPLSPFLQPSPDLVGFLASRSRVPIWLPWPLPEGWMITGVGHAGTDPDGVRATVTACSGPNPFGGGAELLIVAEELGVGLGARYAGVTGPDPGPRVGQGVPEGKVSAGRHPTSLWYIPSPPDRAVYAGSASGLWLWLVFFPATAGVLLIERLELADVRSLGQEIHLMPFGSLTPRLDYPET